MPCLAGRPNFAKTRNRVPDGRGGARSRRVLSSKSCPCSTAVPQERRKSPEGLRSDSPPAPAFDAIDGKPRGATLKIRVLRDAKKPILQFVVFWSGGLERSRTVDDEMPTARWISPMPRSSGWLSKPAPIAFSPWTGVGSAPTASVAAADSNSSSTPDSAPASRALHSLGSLFSFKSPASPSAAKRQLSAVPQTSSFFLLTFLQPFTIFALPV